MNTQPQTPCKYCQTSTPMLGTRMCDYCYALAGAVERDPDMAQRVVAQLLATRWRFIVLGDSQKLKEYVGSAVWIVRHGATRAELAMVSASAKGFSFWTMTGAPIPNALAWLPLVPPQLNLPETVRQ